MTVAVVGAVVGIMVVLSVIYLAVGRLLDLAVRSPPRPASRVPGTERTILGDDWRDKVPASFATTTGTGRNGPVPTNRRHQSPCR